MHVALLTRCTSIDDLEILEGVVHDRPTITAAVVPSAAVLDHLVESGADRPILSSPSIEWVRSARGCPDLTLLPDDVVQSVLARESDIFSQLGLSGATLYFEGPHGSRLPRIASEAAVRCLITPALRSRSGLLVHLDRILPCFGAGPDLPAGDDADELTVALVDPGEMSAATDRVLDTAACDLTTPSAFLDDHAVTGRFTHDEMFAPPDRLLARKLVRLATRLPARPGAEVLDLVIEAARTRTIASDAGADAHLAAHRAVIRARSLIDESRRRADDWARVSRLDWDADGREEIQIELATTSLVVAPSRGGRVLVLDDKVDGLPLGWIHGEPPGVIARTTDGRGRVGAPSLDVQGIDERRDAVTIRMETEAGHRVDVTVADRALEVTYAVEPVTDLRLGPEIPLAIGAGEIRVDGGAWETITDLTTVSGHRFRIRGEEREVLITSMLPTDLAARQSGQGVVVWPHWPMTAPGPHRVRIDLAP